MSVYRDSGAVHFINTQRTVMKCGTVTVIKSCFCSVLCTEKESWVSYMKILAKKKESVLIFSSDILLCWITEHKQILLTSNIFFCFVECFANVFLLLFNSVQLNWFKAKYLRFS
jgi:hypothetical protein